MHYEYSNVMVNVRYKTEVECRRWGTQATNLANFMRTLALPETVAQWSLTSLR